MYSRITNENGSLNSRCLYCFNTVASDVQIHDLDRFEARHICPEKALAQLLARGPHKGPSSSDEVNYLSEGGGGAGAVWPCGGCAFPF